MIRPLPPVRYSPNPARRLDPMEWAKAVFGDATGNAELPAPAAPPAPQIELARLAARTPAEILQHLLDHASWYMSAIELNTHDPEHVDGEELEAEARESLLAATGRRP